MGQMHAFLVHSHSYSRNFCIDAVTDSRPPHSLNTHAWLCRCIRNGPGWVSVHMHVIRVICTQCVHHTACVHIVRVTLCEVRVCFKRDSRTLKHVKHTKNCVLCFHQARYGNHSLCFPLVQEVEVGIPSYTRIEVMHRDQYININRSGASYSQSKCAMEGRRDPRVQGCPF
jgi:hypothetical protein